MIQLHKISNPILETLLGETENFINLSFIAAAIENLGVPGWELFTIFSTSNVYIAIMRRDV